MMKMMMIPLKAKIATSRLKQSILCTSTAPPPFPSTYYPILVCVLLPFNRNCDISFGECKCDSDSEKNQERIMFQCCSCASGGKSLSWMKKETSVLIVASKQRGLYETKEPIKISETLITTFTSKKTHVYPCLPVCNRWPCLSRDFAFHHAISAFR